MTLLMPGTAIIDARLIPCESVLPFFFILACRPDNRRLLRPTPPTYRRRPYYFPERAAECCPTPTGTIFRCPSPSTHHHTVILSSVAAARCAAPRPAMRCQNPFVTAQRQILFVSGYFYADAEPRTLCCSVPRPSLNAAWQKDC